ncbi:hypothetical protein [Candidatus Solincola tengchongensis]|uniref:hypothetical protein n=1 Tax=Candidatus Solincola tengchongensis TaxID=2900693 RepID=UPI00257F61F5|nr:hypothetical protein [Candidatus Solincola tengchongensis]
MKRVNFPPHCRLLEGPPPSPDEGWREAVISGGEHLKRVLEEYGELGFQCLLEELGEENLEGCTQCYKLGGERMFRVYVRRDV